MTTGQDNPDRTARTGQQEQDNGDRWARDKGAGAGQLGQDSRGRVPWRGESQKTVRIVPQGQETENRWPEYDNTDRTTGMGQPWQDNRDSTTRTGQPGQVNLDRSVWQLAQTCEPGQDRVEGLLGHDSKDSGAMEAVDKVAGAEELLPHSRERTAGTWQREQDSQDRQLGKDSRDSTFGQEREGRMTRAWQQEQDS